MVLAIFFFFWWRSESRPWMKVWLTWKNFRIKDTSLTRGKRETVEHLRKRSTILEWYCYQMWSFLFRGLLFSNFVNLYGFWTLLASFFNSNWLGWNFENYIKFRYDIKIKELHYDVDDVSFLEPYTTILRITT